MLLVPANLSCMAGFSAERKWVAIHGSALCKKKRLEPLKLGGSSRFEQLVGTTVGLRQTLLLRLALVGWPLLRLSSRRLLLPWRPFPLRLHRRLFWLGLSGLPFSQRRLRRQALWSS